MKRPLLFLLLFVSLSASAQQKYATISYLKIKVDSMGNLPKNPYVLDLQNKAKHLVVVGTQHSNDTTGKMFTVIESLFNKLKPEIIINEGGNLYKKYTSRNQAIRTDSELGLEKYLADNAGIKTINGDMPDQLEFEQLCKHYSRKEVLVYFGSERFIFPYIFGQDHGHIQQKYTDDFIQRYLLKSGIKLTKEEQTFAYYKKAFRQYFKKDFSLTNIDQRNFTPFLTRSKFNSITRTSKEIRDQYLLGKIQEQLKNHNNILLVFGGWHILALEPALKEIMHLKRCRQQVGHNRKHCACFNIRCPFPRNIFTDKLRVMA